MVESFADYAVEGYERVIISKFITHGDNVFDIGANVGAWSIRVLNAYRCIDLHAFEPMPHVVPVLKQRLAPYEQYGNNIYIHQLGVSDVSKKDVPFLCLMTDNWHNNMGSTFNPEWFAPGRLDNYDPQWIKVNTITLDDYEPLGIDFLKIDVEGHQLHVLKGAQGLLQAQKIRYIQWESGGMAAVGEAEYLQQFGYKTGMFKLNPMRVEPVDASVPFYNYIAWLGDLPHGLKYVTP